MTNPRASNTAQASVGGRLLVLLTVTVAAACAGRGQESSGIVRSGPEWEQYQRALARLVAKPPRDEAFSFIKFSGGIHRDIDLWMKAGPPEAGNGRVRRALTFYVDDTSGRRLRTVPDRLRITAQPPATVAVEEGSRTRNGRLSATLNYGPDQRIAQLQVVIEPWASRCDILVPAGAPGDQRLLYAPWQPFQAPERPADARQAGEFLEFARAAVKGDRPLRAETWAFRRGICFLQGNAPSAALQAFREGHDEFGSALCLWGEMVTLRLLGQREEAATLVKLLVQKHPDSIPAQFANETPGEQWWTPHTYHFWRLIPESSRPQFPPSVAK